jgi:hypothetical protein
VIDASSCDLGGETALRDGVRCGRPRRTINVTRILGKVRMVSARCSCMASLAAMVAISPCVAVAQTEPVLSGAWVLDSSGGAAGDTYGELRIVRQNADGLQLMMVDYGTAWLGGTFRAVLRVMPWTFRYDSWAPRRGGRTSSQPRTRARWSGRTLVLGKLTERGTGDFVWSWNISDDGRRLIHRQGATGWSDGAQDAEARGDSVSFRRVPRGSESGPAFGTLVERLRAAVPSAGEIAVRVNPDASGLIVSCPASDCRIVQFQSGAQTGASRLMRGESLPLSLDAEVRVEPLPGH